MANTITDELTLIIKAETKEAEKALKELNANLDKISDGQKEQLKSTKESTQAFEELADSLKDNSSSFENQAESIMKSNGATIDFKKVGGEALNLVQSQTKGIASSTAELGKFALKLGVTGAGLLALGVILVKTYQAWQEARRANEEYSESLSRVDAQLQLAGKSSEVSSKQVEKWSTDIRRSLNVTKTEAVGAVSELIKYQDISSVLYEDISESAIMLSKIFDDDINSSIQSMADIISDPIAGLEKLQALGISVDEETKKTVINYKEQNRTIEAQQILLAKTNEQLGDAALKVKDYSDATDRLKNAWADYWAAQAGEGQFFNGLKNWYAGVLESQTEFINNRKDFNAIVQEGYKAELTFHDHYKTLNEYSTEQLEEFRANSMSYWNETQSAALDSLLAFRGAEKEMYKDLGGSAIAYLAISNELAAVEQDRIANLGKIHDSFFKAPIGELEEQIKGLKKDLQKDLDISNDNTADYALRTAARERMTKYNEVIAELEDQIWDIKNSDNVLAQVFGKLSADEYVQSIPIGFIFDKEENAKTKAALQAEASKLQSDINSLYSVIEENRTDEWQTSLDTLVDKYFDITDELTDIAAKETLAAEAEKIKLSLLDEQTKKEEDLKNLTDQLNKMIAEGLITEEEKTKHLFRQSDEYQLQVEAEKIRLELANEKLSEEEKANKLIEKYNEMLEKKLISEEEYGELVKKNTGYFDLQLRADELRLSLMSEEKRAQEENLAFLRELHKLKLEGLITEEERVALIKQYNEVDLSSEEAKAEEYKLLLLSEEELSLKAIAETEAELNDLKLKGLLTQKEYNDIIAQQETDRLKNSALGTEASQIKTNIKALESPEEAAVRAKQETIELQDRLNQMVKVGLLTEEEKNDYLHMQSDEYQLQIEAEELKLQLASDRMTETEKQNQAIGKYNEMLLLNLISQKEFEELERQINGYYDYQIKAEEMLAEIGIERKKNANDLANTERDINKLLEFGLITEEESVQLLEKARNEIKEIPGEILIWNDNLKAVAASMEGLAASTISDMFTDLGEALSSGADATGVFSNALGDFAKQTTAQIAQMSIAAGLRVIITEGSAGIPMALGLFALGGVSGILSGAMGGKSSGIDTRIMEGMQEELKAREKLTESLNESLDTEFMLLKDQLNRNIIDYDEFEERAGSINHQRNVADARTTLSANAYAEIEALNAEYSDMSGWDKFWSSKDENLKANMALIQEEYNKIAQATEEELRIILETLKLLGVSIADVPAFATGGTFETNGPQLIMVGDNPSGRELINIQPYEKGYSDSATSKTIIIQGDIYGIEDLYGKLANVGVKLQRRGK